MDLRASSRRLYRQFEKIIIPNARRAQAIYAEALTRHVQRDTVWLDLGCGHRILRQSQFEEEIRLVNGCRRVVGLDYDFPSLRKHRTITQRVRGSVSTLPFAENTFDLITANMVVEHLDDPKAQMREIRRVLKPGGQFLFHTPNIWGYYTLCARLIPPSLRPKLAYLLEGRHEEDVFRTYYRANSPQRIARLAKLTGFKVKQIRMVTSTGHSILALFPPLSLLQLGWIRLLETQSLAPLRPYIIATLRKPGPASKPAHLKRSLQPEVPFAAGAGNHR